ncbi:MAG: hypothetical protein Q9193_003346, partial [Seirophora villosa]
PAVSFPQPVRKYVASVLGETPSRRQLSRQRFAQSKPLQAVALEAETGLVVVVDGADVIVVGTELMGLVEVEDRVVPDGVEEGDEEEVVAAIREDVLVLEAADESCAVAALLVAEPPGPIERHNRPEQPVAGPEDGRGPAVLERTGAPAIVESVLSGGPPLVLLCPLPPSKSTLAHSSPVQPGPEVWEDDLVAAEGATETLIQARPLHEEAPEAADATPAVDVGPAPAALRLRQSNPVHEAADEGIGALELTNVSGAMVGPAKADGVGVEGESVKVTVLSTVVVPDGTVVVTVSVVLQILVVPPSFPGPIDRQSRPVQEDEAATPPALPLLLLPGMLGGVSIALLVAIGLGAFVALGNRSSEALTNGVLSMGPIVGNPTAGLREALTEALSKGLTPSEALTNGVSSIGPIVGNPTAELSEALTEALSKGLTPSEALINGVVSNGPIVGSPSDALREALREALSKGLTLSEALTQSRSEHPNGRAVTELPALLTLPDPGNPGGPGSVGRGPGRDTTGVVTMGLDNQMGESQLERLVAVGIPVSGGLTLKEALALREALTEALREALSDALTLSEALRQIKVAVGTPVKVVDRELGNAVDEVINAGPEVGPKLGIGFNERLTQSKSEHPKGRPESEVLAELGLVVSGAAVVLGSRPKEALTQSKLEQPKGRLVLELPKLLDAKFEVVKPVVEGPGIDGNRVLDTIPVLEAVLCSRLNEMLTHNKSEQPNGSVAGGPVAADVGLGDPGGGVVVGPTVELAVAELKAVGVDPVLKGALVPVANVEDSPELAVIGMVVGSRELPVRGVGLVVNEKSVVESEEVDMTAWLLIERADEAPVVGEAEMVVDDEPDVEGAELETTAWLLIEGADEESLEEAGMVDNEKPVGEGEEVERTVSLLNEGWDEELVVGGV